MRRTGVISGAAYPVPRTMPSAQRETLETQTWVAVLGFQFSKQLPGRDPPTSTFQSLMKMGLTLKYWKVFEIIEQTFL